jgi:hypothetical protein
MTDQTATAAAPAPGAETADPHDDLLMCNCSSCRCELLGRSRHNLAAARRLYDPLPPVLAGRCESRPYCRACLRAVLARRERGA